MAGRLRTRALSLMKQLDLGATGYSVGIEEELRQVRGSAVAPAAATSLAFSAVRCACGTPNDPDAVFCKQCGTRLQRMKAPRASTR